MMTLAIDKRNLGRVGREEIFSIVKCPHEMMDIRTVEIEETEDLGCILLKGIGEITITVLMQDP